MNIQWFLEDIFAADDPDASISTPLPDGGRLMISNWGELWIIVAMNSDFELKKTCFSTIKQAKRYAERNIKKKFEK